jgi:transcriptional regulator with XRE-family HTH domain
MATWLASAVGNRADDTRPVCRLGALIQSERQRRGLSRRDFAGLVRRADRTLTTTEDSVKQWELYGRTPQATTLRAIATALDRPVQDLTALTLETPPPAPAWEVFVDPAGEPEFAEYIRNTVRELVGLEVRHGGNEPGPLASRCLEEVRRRLGRGGAGREVVSAAAELAEVAGWLLHDADRQDAARRLHHEALHLARLAGDHDMELFTLGLLAFVEIWAGRPGVALMIARSALAGPALSSRQVAMFTIREARALAALGDGTGSFRSLERARSALQDGLRSEEPGWAWWLDEAELAHHVGRCHAALGDHVTALAHLQRANELCPPSRVSGRWNYLGNTLETATAAGAWDIAETTLAELLPGAGVIGSGRTENVLRRTLLALSRAPVGPTLHEAAQQLERALLAE